jgi:capsular polysaccharide biosynthesis protein
MFRRHLVLMVAVVVAAAGVGYLTSSRTRLYLGQATIFVGQNSIRPDTKTGQNVSDPIIAAQLAASTYARMLTSETTAAQAVRLAGVARRPSDVAANSIAAQTGQTLLIVVGTRDRDPVVAAKLANGLANALIDQLKQLVPSSASDPPATLFQAATVPTAPMNSTFKRNVELGALLGIVLAAALAILLEYLDVTIRGTVDAERTIELPVLGAVPLHFTDA